MAEVHGKGGDVDISGSVVGAKTWTLSFDGDVVETTDFSDLGIKTFIAGGTGWTGTFTANKGGAPPVTLAASVSIKLEEVAGDATKDWTGTAIITNISTTTDVADIVVYNITFQGTGVLTPPSA